MSTHTILHPTAFGIEWAVTGPKPDPDDRFESASIKLHGVELRNLLSPETVDEIDAAAERILYAPPEEEFEKEEQDA